LEKYILLPSVEASTSIQISEEKTPIIVDLNAADTIELKQLKGIGTVFARRIVSYREKLGVLCTLSQGPMNYLKVFKDTLFDDLDFISANILLPLGGLMIVIFVGWFMGKENVRTEITNNGELKGRFFGIFMFILRIVAPVAIALVFLSSLELISF
jgi:SNF family Na+-dependent transporter